ncbi:MAG: hypothetical protein GY904_19685 [Planctomycetaceae bacterium]|nr:hypothetical protein [Planctomycetaceae bacterium]
MKTDGAMRSVGLRFAGVAMSDGYLQMLKLRSTFDCPDHNPFSHLLAGAAQVTQVIEFGEVKIKPCFLFFDEAPNGCGLGRSPCTRAWHDERRYVTVMSPLCRE